MEVTQAIQELYCLIHNGFRFFLGLKMFNFDHSYICSCSRNAQITFLEKPQLKITSFKDYKH